MKHVSQKVFVQKLGLVGSYQRRAELSAKGYFYHFIVGRFAEYDTDGRIFVRLAHLAVERF